MKKLIFVFCLLPSLCFASVASSPDWVYKTSRKVGDVWQFSGSVHDVAHPDIGIALARSVALGSLASTIAVAVNTSVDRTIEGSQVDGFVESVKISQGYVLDHVAAYGVRQTDVYITRVSDGFDVHVLLEVSEADLARARDDFSKRGVIRSPKFKSKDEGLFKSLIRKAGF